MSRSSGSSLTRGRFNQAAEKQSVLLGVEAQMHVEEPPIRLDILRPAVSEQGLGGLPIAAAQGSHDVEHRSDGTIADTHGWMARLS
jgi:hypothetical protein